MICKALGSSEKRYTGDAVCPGQGGQPLLWIPVFSAYECSYSRVEARSLGPHKIRHFYSIPPEPSIFKV
jgi:hypothetical protein